MADLIARGPETSQRWRRPLPLKETATLGRCGPWQVDWDGRISRKHAKLYWDGNKLSVTRIGAAKNPVFYQGQPSESFSIQPGQHFVIGETTFSLADDPVTVTPDGPQAFEEQTFSPQFLRQWRFRNADQRIEVLSRLPELILGSANDTELFPRLVNLLLAGVPGADAVALVVAAPGEKGEEEEPSTTVRILHWDRRQILGEPFRPSQRLIRSAIGRGESVVHVWSSKQTGNSYTASCDTDWAFCTPVENDSCPGWAIYMSGRFRDDSTTPTPGEPNDLRDEVKFTELATATLGALRQVRQLQHRQAGLSNFFSPLVLKALQDEDPDTALAPRETTVSVLFCDLRGFSKHSEQSSDDLLGLLNRVSRALGVTTHHILETGGVVGDFQGDAVMGFWGWPLPQPDAAQRACQAALAIRQQFEQFAQDPTDPLVDFRMGIGIATGNAVAGKIGTIDQVKVSVFGPVVNLASRLEGLTKILRAPILMDEATSAGVRGVLPRRRARVRRLAVVQPAGMNNSLIVSELVPSEQELPWLTDEHLVFYEQALDAWRDGRWDEAFELLHRVPAEDRAKDFLTVTIAQHNRTPPEDFNGSIRLESKGH